eukprot:1649522-Rhodomonas_salina.2
MRAARASLTESAPLAAPEKPAAATLPIHWQIQATAVSVQSVPGPIMMIIMMRLLVFQVRVCSAAESPGPLTQC